MVPLDEFGANFGRDKDSEGPFAMSDGIIIVQVDALCIAVLYVVAVARECSDAVQVSVDLLVLADAADINRRRGRGLE